MAKTFTAIPEILRIAVPANTVRASDAIAYTILSKEFAPRTSRSSNARVVPASPRFDKTQSLGTRKRAPTPSPT